MTDTASQESVAAWAGRAIPFAIVRSDRKTLSITVSPEGNVIVRAPLRADTEQIAERVSRRGGWICYQQAQTEKWRPRTPVRTFEQGETHLYLGRQYRLVAKLGLVQNVGTSGDRIILTMHRPSRLDGRQALLREWYLQRARAVFSNRLKAVFGPFERLGHAPPRLIIRDLTHRWGSLTARGNLVMSRHLIKASRQCIDYVLIHELCHLEHNNHGAAFWNLLDRMMPDHEKRKAKLERIML